MTPHSQLSSNDIRRDFLEFFRSKGHTVVPSSPLVPGNDPTLLFTNAGMVQFKDVFLGAEKRSYTRAVSSQRCVRAGGKHNDLDQVGYTARHHTFFEMLGNFSFGDYFKRDAIVWAWELLTQVWKLPPERLLVTIYQTDDEAFDIWHHTVGLPAERIIRIGDNKGAPFASDNFWQMADTGPCGPCTEIFYDHGPQHFGGPPGSPDEDGDRYIEIWNNVFMQFDRQPDGSLLPLPAPCVDTGMGLERIAAVLQHVHSNYEIDQFQHLIKAAAQFTATADLTNKSLRVIADHIRACAFLIVDGVLPSNEGRGYVLRRIIRRALRHGWMLGVRGDFFWKMVAPLNEVMGEAYPELAAKQQFVERTLRAEEQRFGETLDAGMRIFDEVASPERRALASYMTENQLSPVLITRMGAGNRLLDANSEHARRIFATTERSNGQRADIVSVDVSQDELSHLQSRVDDSAIYGNRVIIIVYDESQVDELNRVIDNVKSDFGAETFNRIELFSSVRNYRIDGNDVFKLYDTYGFPVDLTADIARERGLTVDMAGFETAMTQQRETARAAGKFGGGVALPAELIAQLTPTEFLGYEHHDAGGLIVAALLKDGRPAEAIDAGDHAIVILDRTPFYAESGGQVGDAGQLAEQGVLFEVADTQKFAGQFFGHVGTLKTGRLARGDHLVGSIDNTRRTATVLNHSATHLLHAALREVLGEHVTQKGSLVAPDRLRFDFSHFQPVSADELAEVERRVNAQIRANHAAEVHHMGMQEALDFGAMALFGEKYGEQVRVLRMGSGSTELCGGTHVGRTGDIGLFKIVSEGGVSAGVRRIEAVSGQGALDHVVLVEQRLDDAARLLGGNPAEVADKLRMLLDRQKKLERELDGLKAKAASGATSNLADAAIDIDGIKVLVTRLEGFDAKALRDAVDRLKQQLGDAVVLLAGVSDGKAALVAGVSGAASGRIKAGELLSHVAGQIGGKGGGRPDLAQGGGDDGPALVKALSEVRDWIAFRLQ